MCTRHCLGAFDWFIISPNYSAMNEETEPNYSASSFMNEETEAKEVQVTFPRSHSQTVRETLSVWCLKTFSLKYTGAPLRTSLLSSESMNYLKQTASLCLRVLLPLFYRGKKLSNFEFPSHLKSYDTMWIPLLKTTLPNIQCSNSSVGFVVAFKILKHKILFIIYWSNIMLAITFNRPS